MVKYKNTTNLRGLGFPTLKGGQGYFHPKEKYDVAWSDLLLSIFTAPESRPINRSFGGRIRELLFAPQSEIDEAVVAYALKETVDRNAPHLKVHQVKVRQERQGVNIEVTFSLTAETANPVRRSVTVPKSFVSGKI
jgi:phage baseplate assembly protein W